MIDSHIRKVRKYINMTLKELTTMSEISKYRLIELEKDRTEVKVKEAIALSKSLNCSVFDIIDISAFDHDSLLDLRNKLDEILK